MGDLRDLREGMVRRQTMGLVGGELSHDSRGLRYHGVVSVDVLLSYSLDNKTTMIYATTASTRVTYR